MHGMLKALFVPLVLTIPTISFGLSCPQLFVDGDINGNMQTLTRNVTAVPGETVSVNCSRTGEIDSEADWYLVVPADGYATKHVTIDQDKNDLHDLFGINITDMDLSSGGSTTFQLRIDNFNATMDHTVIVCGAVHRTNDDTIISAYLQHVFVLVVEPEHSPIANCTTNATAPSFTASPSATTVYSTVTIEMSATPTPTVCAPASSIVTSTVTSAVYTTVIPSVASPTATPPSQLPTSTENILTSIPTGFPTLSTQSPLTAAETSIVIGVLCSAGGLVAGLVVGLLVGCKCGKEKKKGQRTPDVQTAYQNGPE